MKFFITCLLLLSFSNHAFAGNLKQKIHYGQGLIQYMNAREKEKFRLKITTLTVAELQDLNVKELCDLAAIYLKLEVSVNPPELNDKISTEEIYNNWIKSLTEDVQERARIVFLAKIIVEQKKQFQAQKLSAQSLAQTALDEDSKIGVIEEGSTSTGKNIETIWRIVSNRYSKAIAQLNSQARK